jgi:group I intron endonuclease
MAFGYIYKIVNTINTKVYIGQTTRSIAARFKEHLRNCNTASKKSMHLYTAMNAYGKDNFSIELLEEAASQDELNEKEIYWINYYDSLNNGYNMKQGGQDENPMNSSIVKEKHDIKMRSEEVRTKISKAMSEYRSINGFSDIHRQKLSEAAKNQIYFYKADKITHTNKNNQARIEQLLQDGWTLAKPDKLDKPAAQTEPAMNNLGKIKAFATRSVPCYCILITGERFSFGSILEAGLWWYNNFKPFGETYSEVTYQRKIKASIAGKSISFGTRGRPDYKEVTNIKWYK